MNPLGTQPLNDHSSKWVGQGAKYLQVGCWVQLSKEVHPILLIHSHSQPSRSRETRPYNGLCFKAYVVSGKTEPNLIGVLSQPVRQ